MSSITGPRLPLGLLYHYTDARGLMGILDSQTLWATNIHYLNDSQEFDYARTVANKVILQRAEAASDRREKEVLTFIGQLGPAGVAPRVFVTSFSEEGDLLSQWRGYCPSGDGYSIGFEAKDLRNEAMMQRFFLAPCLYDDESQDKAIEQVLDAFMKSSSWIRALEHPEDDDSRRAVILAWSDILLPWAATIKHRGFREEWEWRLVSPLIPWGDPQCLVRVGRSMLIPYVKFNLVAFGPYIPVKEIIIGPTPHMWLAIQALGSLLDSKRESKSLSETPITIHYYTKF
jgi:hypothetical protein